MIRYIAVVLLAVTALAPGRGGAQNCTAPELICKAAANQDRSLYFRDHCRYEQKIHIERYKVKGNKEATEELRDTTVTVEPAKKPKHVWKTCRNS